MIRGLSREGRKKGLEEMSVDNTLEALQMSPEKWAETGWNGVAKGGQCFSAHRDSPIKRGTVR